MITTMCNEEPDISPLSVYCVKETCALLDISGKTLAKMRKAGKIMPVNPEERNYRYTGAAIRRLWRIINHQPL